MWHMHVVIGWCWVKRMRRCEQVKTKEHEVVRGWASTVTVSVCTEELGIWKSFLIDMAALRIHAKNGHQRFCPAVAVA